MPAIDAEGPLAYSKTTGKLTIDLSNYYNKTGVDEAIAAGKVEIAEGLNIDSHLYDLN